MKCSKNELLVYIYLGIVSLCKGFNLTNESLVYVGLYVLATGLVFFRFCNDKYTIKELLVVASFFIISILIAYNGKNLTPLYFAISLLGLKNIDWRKAINVIFWTKLVSFICMILLSSAGIIESNYYMHYRNSIGVTRRYSFGYLHPNLAHMHLVILMIMFYYLYKNKTNLFTDVLCLAINILFYQFTYSRTSFFICFIFILYSILSRYGKKNLDKKVALMGKYSFVIFLILSILLGYMWNKSNLVRQIDTLITGRIYYCYELITNYTIPLIGAKEYGNSLFDNSFFSMMYQCGIVFTILISYFSIKCAKKLYKNKNYSELVMIFFMNLMSLLESIYYTPVMNFSILFLSCVIYKNKEVTRKEEESESNSINSYVQ